ncbi:MAG: molecular chaperone DnaJ [Gammaproteobacteria bacterium]|nr:molecular chaperone DnaJ [Gammaproteobacteria bacterium]
MCNPRRVQVTATREIAEAWQREISRSASLSAQVSGEARVRQPLSASLGTPVLQALEALLAADNSDWRETEQGYRYEVEGGYVIYDTDEHTLEIVAALQDSVETEATATQVVSGEHKETLHTTQTGQYYDDAYGGRTHVHAEADARQAAQKELDQQTHARMQEIEEQAEEQNAETVHAQARAEAQVQLDSLSRQRQTELSLQARQNLDAVGLRCRQAFNALLAQAYRDAILAYARRNGAEGIACQDNDDIVEIEFFLEN